MEVTKTLAPGVEYTFWTFGGSVPGMFIRVREGDEVEFHLTNAASSVAPHNIDLHAVPGPHGGGHAPGGDARSGPGRGRAHAPRHGHDGGTSS